MVLIGLHSPHYKYFKLQSVRSREQADFYLINDPGSGYSLSQWQAATKNYRQGDVQIVCLVILGRGEGRGGII